MPDRYPIPLGEASSEFSEKNSIFIGTAGHAATVEEAQTFIAELSARYDDANHNAWAYLVGYGSEAVYACHNDGEPGGTAGPPALGVLQGSGLGDVVVVVTRYFGGVKLGTGGLVRAYGRAAREAIAALPRGEKVATTRAVVHIDYSFHDSFVRLLEPHEAQIERTEYGIEVQFHTVLPVDRFDGFVAAITEMTSGKAVVERDPDISAISE